MKHYYEYNYHDYYALIVVTVDVNDLYTKPYKKATEIYVEIVGGTTVEEVLDKTHPDLITKERAFYKVLHDVTIQDKQVQTVIDEFARLDNGVLLVDASLL